VIGHRDEVQSEPLPAGKYWVGDLCYVMHDCWDEVCELLFEGRDDHGCNQGTFQLKDGRRFAIYNTQYGDGQYHSSHGEKYPVDSGSLGCILVSDISEEEKKYLSNGTIEGFPAEFYTGRDNDGTIFFGDIKIFTGDDNEEDDWEFEEEE
jgi:hypothetical protein